MLHTKLYLLHAPFLKILNFFKNQRKVGYNNWLADAKQADIYIQSALSVFQSYELQGKTLLELGPGKYFSAALTLAHLGAKVSVADRFLTAWDDTYHPKLYNFLAKKHPEIPVFAKVVKQNSYAGILELIPEGAETLNAPAPFDFVFSNAVLEHLEDPALAFKNLYRLTKSGGKHFHQVDLRYHTFMSKPLEHLLLDQEDFISERTKLNCTNGCQWRNQEFIEFFAQAGFKDLNTQSNQLVDPKYFSSFLPRLRSSKSSYKDWPEDDLKIIGSFYTFSKPE